MCIPEHKRLNIAYKPNQNISTLKQYPPTRNTNTHGTHTRHEHRHGAKLVRINPPQHTDNSTRHTHEHEKDKSRNLQWWLFSKGSQFCSGGNLGMQPTLIRLQISYNNTLQKLYKDSIIICYYIRYVRNQPKSKEIRFIYCTLSRFCA